MEGGGGGRHRERWRVRGREGLSDRGMDGGARSDGQGRE